MKKDELLALFGGSKPEAAKALGVSRATIYGWADDELPEEALLRVRSWFLATQGRVPRRWMPRRQKPVAR